MPHPVSSRITPVILSGGSGTRLWPMSTPTMPKQFLPLTSACSMFELTLGRVIDSARFTPPIIVANARHAELIERQLAAAGVLQSTLILEPAARNTAAAIALAAFEAGDAPILVMPSDHIIDDVAAFGVAVARGLILAREGWLVTFGITPENAETGYGYIRLGASLTEGAFEVDMFIEKPQREAAEAMIASGGHAWNGGIFLFRAQDYLSALEQFAPEIWSASKAAHADAERDGARCVPDRAAFAAAPPISVDYAVMEKAARVAVVPVTMGWSDIGSWAALHAHDSKDADGNSLSGPVRLIEGSGNLIRSDGIRISALGVDDLVIIASGNEIVILPRERSQDVRLFADPTK